MTELFENFGSGGRVLFMLVAALVSLRQSNITSPTKKRRDSVLLRDHLPPSLQFILPSTPQIPRAKAVGSIIHPLGLVMAIRVLASEDHGTSRHIWTRHPHYS